MSKYPDNWWEKVRSMPFLEAEFLLRQAKVDLLEKHPVNTPGYFEAGIEVQKLNAEIHRIAQILNRASWKKAAQMVLTPELYEAVAVQREILQAEAEKEFEALK